MMTVTLPSVVVMPLMLLTVLIDNAAAEAGLFVYANDLPVPLILAASVPILFCCAVP